MSYRLLQFGDVVLPTARISGTYGTGPTVNATVRVVGGMYDANGNGTAPLSLPYEQTYSAWLVGTAAATQAALEDLQALRGTRHILYRVDEYDSSQQWCWARCTQVRTPWQIQRKTVQPVDIVFQIQTPWYGSVYGDGWSLNTGEDLDDGLFLEEDATYTLDASPKSITLTNGGNALSRLVSLKITVGPTAALTEVTVEVGDCDWTWAGTVAVNKVLEVNGRTMTITNDGSDAYSGLTLNADHATGWWLELEPGANTLTVTITGGSTDSTIEFDCADGWE